MGGPRFTALPTITPTRTSAWSRPAVGLGFVLIAIVAAYFDTGAVMVGIWSRSDSFAHAFVVPPISLWLIWRQRGKLRVIAPRPAPLALAAIALASTSWLVGEAGGINALSQAALVALIVAAVPLTLGSAVARTLLFPLLFLFFAVPAGEFMLPSLMQSTADFTILALRASGIPVYREGLRFAIPTGSWSVVEACSGVRYLMASFMVGTLFAYLNYYSLKKRLIFSVISIAVPIVANWLRAYMIVMIGHLSGNQYGVGVDHLIYGWVFFGIVVMALFMIGARWADPYIADDVSAVAATSTMPAQNTAIRAATWWVPALASVLIVTPTMLTRGWKLAQAVEAPVALELPTRLGNGWTVQENARPVIEPSYSGASGKAHRIYTDGMREIGVFIAYYRQQRDGRKLVTSTNVVVSSSDEHWNAVDRTRRALDAGDRTATVSQWRLRESRGAVAVSSHIERLAWETYWVDERLTSREIEAKALGAWQRLTAGDDDGAAIVIHTQSDSGEDPERLLEVFWRANVDTLVGLLRNVRRGR